MKSRAFLWLLLLGICCRPSPTRADSAPATARVCEQTPACAELAQQARQFSRANQLPEALAAYQNAEQLSGDPKLLFNIARVMHRMGRLAEASGYYRRYLDAGAEGNPEQRKKSEEYLAQAQRFMPGQPDPAPQSSLTDDVTTTHLPLSPTKDCSGPSRSRKLKIGGWTLLGLGGAFVVAAIAPSVLSTMSSRCTQADGSNGQLCDPPPASAPNLWPVAGVGYGLGALSVASGVGLLVWSGKERTREASQGEALCPH